MSEKLTIGMGFSKLKIIQFTEFRGRLNVFLKPHVLQLKLTQLEAKLDIPGFGIWTG